MPTLTDPYVAAEPDAEPGHLRVTLASGRSVRFACTVPVEGVLRLRLVPPGGAGGPAGAVPREGDDLPGPDPILVDLPHRPARLTVTGEGVEITGPGVRAVWERGGPAQAEPGGGPAQGLRFGPFRRFSEPGAATVPFSAGYRPAGDGRPAGWVETIHLAPDAAVYGGGESYQGIDLRGRHRMLRNTEENRAAGRDSAYLNVPLLWSDAGWGLFVHTGCPVEADIGATHSEAVRVQVDGDALDLFLLTGDAPTLLGRYLALTGRPGDLPDWAYGVWMSRSSYFTAEEVVRTVDELRAAGCPVDVVHVDEWMEESVLDDASWNAGPDRARFPAGWTGPLAERGVRASLWINPYVRRGTALADELAARGHLVRGPDGRPVATADNPETLAVDFTHPAARRWWCERLTRTLREEGNAAVLADFGEEIPDDAVFADGSDGLRRHNTYGLLYQEAVRDAGVAARDGDFVSLCRSGTAGSHRDPGHWAGDLPSTWTGLVSTLRAVLSLALSGCSVVTHDAGGYWSPASYRRAQELRATMTPDAVPADVEPELYARWAQWAAFSPITRFHGVGRREPTAYPEPARSAAVAACRLRARLRPYVAASARLAARDGGLPLVRPMPLAFPGDRAARDADLQYLFGPDVLVAPLLEPGGHRRLWVPAGEWEPLLGCPPLHGPGWREVSCPPEAFPTFVRAERGAAAVLGGPEPG
ncbi:glycoside hydrolase family 31 protein [Allostreptomyces psammosilenae]|uniref:Alpha-D-xyloside xylohydrolase n=1 Tax=Allostreptomyces psammosilenae TaxID=1892865 RepID=A0A853A9J8_9ACTN|nr:glycoside hydrolase family 31 protein [Allostreptomyces psammosilenae]NYI07188.1 alpha-D-xyloside xylohydrolase [Allostreptomyces psammosilenae]